MYIRLTDMDIERAKKVDLLSFLRNVSPMELVRVSSNEYSLRSHDSMKISNGKWYWFSRGIGGNSALDYLMKAEGMNFRDAVLTINGQEKQMERSKVYPEEKKYLRVPGFTYKLQKAREYLSSRGIQKSVIDRCIKEKRIGEDVETGALLFFGRDENGYIKQCSIRLTDGSSGKRDAPGSDKLFGFCLEGKDKESLAVFESAIDLMSMQCLYEEMGVEKTPHMMSLSGVFFADKGDGTCKLPKSMERYLNDHREVKNILLCLDADDAGRNCAMGLIRTLENKYSISYLPPPFGKDYNEYLQEKQKESVWKEEFLKVHEKECVMDGKEYPEREENTLSNMVYTTCENLSDEERVFDDEDER